MRVEDKDKCAECGGFCCKKSGCDYYPEDFTDLGIESLTNILNEGNVSIVGAVEIKRLPNGKHAANNFLYLRARNVDRGPVDIFSLKKQCSMLTETGCSYDLEHRPSGGANLKPIGLDSDSGIPLCRGDENPYVVMSYWAKYQNVLRKAVKRISGMTVEQCFMRDLEQVLVDIFTENFDGVSPLEIADISSLLPILVTIYPETYQKAKVRASKDIRFLQKSFK